MADVGLIGAKAEDMTKMEPVGCEARDKQKEKVPKFTQSRY